MVEPGKKPPAPSWSLVWKEKPTGIGERSGAGAAGGMLVRRDALPETPALENIRVQGHAAGEKRNVGHSYKTRGTASGDAVTLKRT